MSRLTDQERMALLRSNDPTQSTSYDYEVNRGRGGDPLMQDIGGVTPMTRYPLSDLPQNATKATMMAALARLLMDAPGALKATAAVPAFYSADYGMDAYRNYQQMQGTHPMQQREDAWRRQMEAAGRPTQETPFRRGWLNEPQ